MLPHLKGFTQIGTPILSGANSGNSLTEYLKSPPKAQGSSPANSLTALLEDHLKNHPHQTKKPAHPHHAAHHPHDSKPPLESSGGTNGTPDPTPSSPAGAGLTHSTTPIHTTHDGQVIENLDLYVTSGNAITVSNDNVIIRNCRIHYVDGSGISVSGANNVTIEHCEVINSSPPSGNGPETNPNLYDIVAYQSQHLTVQDVTVRDGSSGIYLLESPGAKLSNIDGYDFHGPMPRGQFIQFDKSGNSTLTDFYTQNNPAHSHTEDNISVYDSPNVTISNGLIDGNNSPTGVGIMFEGNSSGGKVSHVDAIHEGDGAFSSYSPNVTFEYTRSFDNIAGNQGRGSPSSNALIWNVSAAGVKILNSTYTHPANPQNIVWDASKAVVADVHNDPTATPMGIPVVHHFDWH